MNPCPHCGTTLKLPHPAAIYRCGSCQRTFRLSGRPSHAPSSMKAATRSGIVFVGSEARRGRGHAERTASFPVQTLPRNNPQEIQQRTGLRQEAARQAREWLEELEYWQAQGLDVPQDLLSSARTRAQGH